MGLLRMKAAVRNLFHSEQVSESWTRRFAHIWKMRPRSGSLRGWLPRRRGGRRWWSLVEPSR